jgi:Flp pilus assembly protein TadG
MKIYKQKGASVLEFTITIPVLIMFLILVSEVGILFYTLGTLSKTTQGAARYMSEVKAEFATRKPIAESLLKYGNVSNTAPPLLPGGDTKVLSVITDTGTHVSVVVSYQHDLIMGPVLGAFTSLSTLGSVSFGNTFNMIASSIMRFAK